MSAMSRPAPVPASRAAKGQPASRRRRSGPRALFLIALCFTASVIVRAGDPEGAIAREAAPLAAALSADTASDPPGDGQYPRPLACTPDPGIDALLAAIRDRDAQLGIRDAALAERETVLEVARVKIAEQLAALEDAERRLADTLAIADKAAETDIARLISVYETMNPKAAAQIFASMDVGFAAGFVARLKPEIAAAILAGLPADRAYAVSAAIAGRNARAPTE